MNNRGRIILAVIVVTLGLILWRNWSLYAELEQAESRGVELREQRKAQHERETERMIREGR